MSYLILRDGVPEEYTLRQLRIDNPSISFSENPSEETLAEYGVHVYELSDLPEASVLEKIVDDGFEKVDSKWFKVWRVEIRPKEQRDAIITAERDKRIRSIFTFNGYPFNADEASIQRIAGAASLAGFSLLQGAEKGDLYWHGGAEPFGWITADNEIIHMDAETTFALGRAAATNETLHVFASRALKDMDPPADDPTDDQWWPQ